MQIPSAPISLNQVLLQLACFLKDYNFNGYNSDAPSLVAKLLVMNVLGYNKVELILNSERLLKQSIIDELFALALRHAQGEPIAYILGKKEFYGLDFKVTPNTLIPRPESEDVIDAVLGILSKQQSCLCHDFIFADVGTGSGCLACVLASKISRAKGFMVDVCANALQVAIENSINLGFEQRLFPIQACLHTLPFSSSSLDLLISNPPYISEDEFLNLNLNVRNYEPKIALVPSSEQNLEFNNDLYGLSHLSLLAKQAFYLLKDNGICIVEHGATQADAVFNLFAQNGTWKFLKSGQDLAGLNRYFLAIR